MKRASILAILLFISSSLCAAERLWLAHTIESSHPYNNLSQQEWSLNSLYANKVTLAFERVALATGDRLVLTDRAGNILAQYIGPLDLNNFETEEFETGAVKISLLSDAHTNQWGFKLKGFFYTHSRISVPQVIFNHLLPLQNRALLKGFYVFQDQTLNVMERVYQENGLPITGKITRLKFSDAGVETLSDIYTRHAADGPLLSLNGALYGGFEGRIAQLPRGYAFEMYRPFANVSQLFYQDNTLVALAGGRIHTIDIGSANDWQYTMERSSLPSVILEDSDRISFKDKTLIVNKGWTAGEVAIYNLDDPYHLYSRPSIKLNLGEHDRLVFSGWVPTMGKGHVYLPNGNTVSSYSVETANEVGYLPLPERVGATANSFCFDNNILYVPGHSKVYRINVSDPTNLQLIDEIQVTREVRSQGIYSLWVENKKLYVLRKNHAFQNNGSNGFSLTIVRLP